MARLHAASAWTALIAMQLGCSSEGGGSSTSSSAGDPAGSGGTGSSQGAGGGAVASSSASGIGPGSGSTGGGAVAMNCDPPAAPGSIYEKTAETYDIEQPGPVSMCAYRGDVMLIVNIAAL